MGNFIININNPFPEITGKIIQWKAIINSSGNKTFILKNNEYNIFSLVSNYNLYEDSFNKLIITNISQSEPTSIVNLEHNGTILTNLLLPYEIDISSVTTDLDLIPNLIMNYENIANINNISFTFYITNFEGLKSNSVTTTIYNYLDS